LAVNAPILKPFLSKARKAMSSIRPSNENSSQNLPDSLRLSHVERKGKRRTVHEIDNIDMSMNGSGEHIVRQGTDEERASSDVSSRDEGDAV